MLVHAHYCCPICFEAPSGFYNFEVHGGQYWCPICFEAPSGFNNFEVYGQYSCPICFEAPSGGDNREVLFILFINLQLYTAYKFFTTKDYYLHLALILRLVSS
jgi:hypothetical protein